MTKNKALKKLAEKYATGGPPTEDEFTVSDWCDATGLSNSHAAKQLRTMRSAGEVTHRTGKINGRVANIYRPV
jgi:hypothetical protein